MSAIKTVGIVGTGVIGASWTALFLAHGLQVLPDLKKLGLASNASLDNYISVGASLKDHYAELDLVQENATERVDLKTKLIAEINTGTRPEVIIASSSSGLPSSKFIGECRQNPGRVLIGHPFNPPHLMPLVEVVPNPQAAKENVDAAVAFYKSLGKNAVVINQEILGFAANRLQAVLCTEAYSLVSRGIMSAKDLDLCMTSSLGPRWALTGPLMSTAMGGGGGTDGFRHLLEHLGPASKVWLEDMKQHAFTYDKDDLDALSTSVGKELQGKDVKALEAKRDSKLASH
ncbi:3-hydroxyacyl-CoA dehyrogenase [Aureobasidium namibiae CBS 147.97]|uniref:3-hydroxyacyl-CoA dehyrogenase n=1 Tax=Aureobasidium namibiae CBS 147.97 TaxID=1043004 RepID=A0A074W931_9PEZI